MKTRLLHKVTISLEKLTWKMSIFPCCTSVEVGQIMEPSIDYEATDGISILSAFEYLNASSKLFFLHLCIKTLHLTILASVFLIAVPY